MTNVKPNPNANIALLGHPNAGAGRAVQPFRRLATAIDRAGLSYTPFLGNWPEQLDGFTDVFLVGGDGTLHVLLNTYPALKLPVSLFGGGTGNDFFRLLHGRDHRHLNPESALNTPARAVDLATCNGRYFVNGLGIGIEGTIARRLAHRKKLPGKISYLLAAVVEIFRYRASLCSIESGATKTEGRFLLLNVANGPWAGGGFRLSPAASATDGELNMVLATDLPPLQRLRYLPVMEKGKHLGLPFVSHFTVKSVCIRSETKLPYHLDGEYGEACEWKIEVIPGGALFRFP